MAEDNKDYPAIIDQINRNNEDLTAERDSLKNENDTLRAEVDKIKEELKKTKELNFTLARNFAAEDRKSAEDILNEMF